MAGDAGDEHAPRLRRARAREGEQRRRSSVAARSGRSSQIAIAGREGEQERGRAPGRGSPPEHRVAHQRDQRRPGRTPSAARTSRSPRRRRSGSRRARPQRDADAQSRSCTQPAGGRAAARSRSAGRTGRPRAISDRKTIQRRITSAGVAAVSEIEGMTNCGAGPAFGPDREGERAADRVAVDRDHAPVDEVPALGDVLAAGRRACSGRRRARAAAPP